MNNPVAQTGKRPNPFHKGELHRLQGWRLLLCKLLIGLLRLYYVSLRMRMPEADRTTLAASSQPRLIVVSHNRSLLGPRFIQKYLDPRQVTCLISPSKAAAWEVEFYEYFGFRVVRGSSSRRGIESTREMIRAFQQGYDLGITPDGPSGPLYEFKRGAGMLARRTGAPVLVMTANCKSAIRLKSWDKHLIPLPFSRVEIRCRLLESYQHLGFTSDQQAAEAIRSACLAITTDPFKLYTQQYSNDL